MRLPESLVALADQGIIERVLRPLKSGKEAQVFLVEAGDRVRVAKVYKDADERSFKHRAQYTEGRRVRNSRDQRAIQKRTRHGRSQDEAAWKSAEVDVIYRLHAAGVRVPEPYNFIDGVLIMELVEDARGEPAPRLAELALDADRARTIFDQLLREVVKMLSAGIVHGDLSDYNVLVDERGPVVIDFPQSVDASVNRNARSLLLRDVDNLTRFLSRFANAPRRPYGQELWAAYEDNTLSPDMELTGRWKRSGKATDMASLLYEIEAAEDDERRRREALGQPMPRPRKREVVMTPAKPARSSRSRGNDTASPPQEAPKKRRRRRRRKPPADANAAQPGAHGRGRGPDSKTSSGGSPEGRGKGRGGGSRSPGPHGERRQGEASAREESRPDDPPPKKKRRRRRRRKPKGERQADGGGGREGSGRPARRDGDR